MYNFWGVVPETATKHPWAGLSTFKRGFGGAEEQYVHAKDLPLSLKYWLTYTIEKVRKMKRRL
jgi:lipid II:glycine glycyltransferase (peptidoglycan interpeptide bridge formation enzyme)